MKLVEVNVVGRNTEGVMGLQFINPKNIVRIDCGDNLLVFDYCTYFHPGGFYERFILEVDGESIERVMSLFEITEDTSVQ